MTKEYWLLFLLVFPIIFSLIGFCVGKKNETLRDILYIIVTFANLLIVIYLYNFVKSNTIEFYVPYLLGTGLFLKLDIFRFIFISITSFVWFIATVYSSQYLIHSRNRNRYYLFFMLTYSSTLGFFISNNLINLFTFYEIMSLCAYPIIIHDEDENAHEASKTYITMTLTSGFIILMGIFISYSLTNTLNIREISEALIPYRGARYLVGFLMIIGFGIKAGMVPLHIWLPKAHPAAPTPASAVLSGIIVKTGVFGIIIVYYFIMHCDIYISLFLILCGFINLLLGGFYAMFELNIKKVLAYSSISQMGYLFLGIGCIGLLSGHEEIAIYGVLFHIVNHALFKVMLFMGVGIIYMVTHSLDINALRGFGRYKPTLKLTFFIGFCAIIGLPGFNGFTSKTMIHHALSESIHYSGFNYLILGDIIFYIAGALTTAYLLKIYFALFVFNNPRYYADYKGHINFRALFPMVISSILIIVLGIFPNVFLKYIHGINNIFHLSNNNYFYNINLFTFENIFSALINIILGIFVYKYYILKKLIVTNNDGEKLFINTLKDSFNIENNLYIPVLNYLFNHLLYIIKLIDGTLYQLYKLLMKSTLISFHIKAHDDKRSIFIKNLFNKIYLQK